MTEKYLLVERKPQFGFVEIRERNLKCFLLRFLIPISGLIDALISIFTLTLFKTNFRYVIACRHIQEVALHEHEVIELGEVLLRNFFANLKTPDELAQEDSKTSQDAL